MKLTNIAAMIATGLWAILLLLPAIKIIEVHREIIVRENRNPHLCERAGVGIMRRLNDPSFWAVLAAALSARLVHRTLARLEVRRTVSLNGRDLPLAGVAIGLTLGAYLLAVYLRNETFFFYRPLDPNKPLNEQDAVHWNPEILGIQFFEGCLISLVIVTACLLLPLGLAALRAVRAEMDKPEFKSDPALREETRWCAAWVADAGFKPLAVFILLVTWELASRLIGWKDFYPWNPLMGLAGMLALVWPSFVLLIPGCWLFAKKVPLTVEKWHVGAEAGPKPTNLGMAPLSSPWIIDDLSKDIFPLPRIVPGPDPEETKR